MSLNSLDAQPQFPSNVPEVVDDSVQARDGLAWALHHYCHMRGRLLDKLQLSHVIGSLSGNGETWADASHLCRVLDLPMLQLLGQPDPARLPLLAYAPEYGWGVVVQGAGGSEWVMRRQAGEVRLPTQVLNSSVAELPLLNSEKDEQSASQIDSTHALPGFASTLRESLKRRRGPLADAVVASVFINCITLAISIYSMQVYDRVIPTQGYNTLVVLLSGVFIALAVELAMKIARARVMDSVVAGVDSQLSRHIFQRLLSVRIDQLPGSVGSLASQIRGYEQVRSFYTSSTLFALVDLPMGLLFLAVILAVGGPWVAAVPFFLLLLALAAGVLFRRRFNALAATGAVYSNKKTGLLVEAVEGAETIKAGAGGWKFLQRWLAVSSGSIKNDIELRANTEQLSFATALLNQLSYVGIVTAGAWQAMEGNLTLGGLIACSILGGRVLMPIAAIPSLFVQHAQAKAATTSLEQMYALETDTHGVGRPLLPAHVAGHFQLQNIQFSYAGPKETPVALDISQLQIQPGERIGILGPIGSGKSTLLRLLSGMYRPQKGRVLLDGLDIGHIDRQIISDHVGYLQQDTRLIQGTLRDNLLVGLPDPGDDAIFTSMRKSGLIRLVSSHPRGLELPIMEGGKGLSGGQRQLVAFTRLLLTQPKVWLLDEPTASMDDDLERNCLSVLAEALTPDRTLVVVTHKMSLLPMVRRLIVVVGHRVVMDSTRDEVLARLAQDGQPKPVSVTALRS